MFGKGEGKCLEATHKAATISTNKIIKLEEHLRLCSSGEFQTQEQSETEKRAE